MRLDYVDIFYSHRFDPQTPLEETMGALASAVTQGKTLYVGISSYSPQRTREAVELLQGHGDTLLDPSALLFDVQPLDREQQQLLATLEELGLGCIAFSPLPRDCLPVAI